MSATSPRRAALAALGVALVTLGAVAAPSAGARAEEVAVLVVDGRGWGHGVGLAQDGAYWMGRGGASTAEVLGHFYPGTSVASAGGPVRVVVLERPEDGPHEAVVALPAGGELRSPRHGPQAEGFPVAVPPGRAALVRWDPADGSYHASVLDDGQGHAAGAATVGASLSASEPVLVPPSAPTTSTSTTSTTSTTLAPGPGGPASTTTTTTAPPQGPAPDEGGAVSQHPVWVAPAEGGVVALPGTGRRYRGEVEATAAADRFRLVNELHVEQYLRGMGEVRDPSWPAASLRAQAVVARTYALRAMRANGEICATQRCQVYLGQQVEYPAMDRAVEATSGQVLVYGDALAATVYSANAGGVSATTEEGFGTPGGSYPYLRSTPYPTRDPMPWRVEVALADLGGRLGYPGELRGASVTGAGPSGRATTVTLSGDAGELVVSGIDLARTLGLRSTLFELRVTEAETAPEAPEPAALVQELPADAGADRDPGRREEVGATAATARSRAVLEAVTALPPAPLESETSGPRSLWARLWPVGLAAVVIGGAAVATPAVASPRGGLPLSSGRATRRARGWPARASRRGGR